MMEVSGNVGGSDVMSTQKKHPNASRRVLQLLTDLVTVDAAKRVKICRQLVTHVVALSKQTDDVTSLQYIVSRLVRGLASSRPGARASLFTALVGTLSAVPSDRLSSAAVLECCPASPPPGSDNRARVEHALCVLLTSGALVRAHRLDLKLDQLTAGLWSGWSFKSYMPSLATPFLVSLITQLDEARFSAEMWPLLEKRLSVGWSQCSEDLLWLLVVCRSNFPSVCTSDFLQRHWGCKKLFSSEAYTAMIKVVKSSAVHLPTIHPSVTALFDCVAGKSSRLLLFCQQLVEPLLVDRTACPLAQALLQMVVPRLSSPQLVRAVLTPAVVGSLLRSLPKRDLLTENGARGLASALTSLALHPDTSADTQMALLCCLMTRPGSVCFDAITGTKLLSIIVGALKPDALEPFVKITTEIFHGEFDGQKQTDRGRAMACVFLSRAVLHSSSPPIALKLRVLKLLFDTAFTTAAADTEHSNVADEIAFSARRQFFKAVLHPVRQSADQERLLWQVCCHQRPLVSTADNCVSVLRPAAAKVWLHAVSLAKKMRESEAASEWQSGGGRLLLAVSVLMLSLCQLLLESAKQNELHTFLCDVLKDICECALSCTSEVESPAKDEQESSKSGALLDIILNVLSLLNSHSVRGVVREAFSVMVPALSRAELLRFFSVLSPDYSLEDDFSDEEEDEESGEESDSAETNDEVDSDTDDSGIDREDSADDPADDDDDGGEGQLGVYSLRERLQSALADVAADDDDSSDIDMDTVPAEHLEKIDAALVKTFRALKKNKGDKRSKTADKEASLMNFRIRVLDLVDVTARVCSGSLACLDLLPVLVSLLAAVYLDRRQGALVSRLRSSLNQLCINSCRNVKDPQLSGEYLAEILNVLLEQGSRLPSASVDMGTSLASAVKAVVRNSVQLAEDQSSLVTDTILSALHRFLHNRECILPPRLFSQLFSLADWPGQQLLLLKLAEAAGDQSVRSYRRSQSVAMLAATFQQPASLHCLSGKQVRSIADRLIASFHQTVEQLEASSSTDTSGGGVNERLLCAVFEATMLSIRVAIQRCGSKSVAKCRVGAQRVVDVMRRVGARVNRGRCGKLYRKLMSQHSLDSDGDVKGVVSDPPPIEKADKSHRPSKLDRNTCQIDLSADTAGQVTSNSPSKKKHHQKSADPNHQKIRGKRSGAETDPNEDVTEQSTGQNTRKKKKLK